MNFVHNDLKLENLVVGRDNPNEIYLIDFGLASLWQDEETKQHVGKMQMDSFEGNFGFATGKQCGGQRTSRRDDV